MKVEDCTICDVIEKAAANNGQVDVYMIMSCITNKRALCKEHVKLIEQGVGKAVIKIGDMVAKRVKERSCVSKISSTPD